MQGNRKMAAQNIYLSKLYLSLIRLLSCFDSTAKSVKMFTSFPCFFKKKTKWLKFFYGLRVLHVLRTFLC